MSGHANHLSESLFLFDIDGTLLDVRGDGKRALLGALSEELGVAVNPEFPLKGAVDRLIFSGFYESAEYDPDKFEYHWGNFVERYISSLSGLSGESWIIFPGAVETVRHLHGCSNIAVATGNIPAGASVKLDFFGLKDYFSCGGYGDNALSRAHLVENAIADAEKHYRREFDRKKIYMIGDTDKDVRAAHDNGIVPVLIDHYGAHSEMLNDWKVRYYGSFSGFKSFLSRVSADDEPSEVFRF